MIEVIYGTSSLAAGVKELIESVRLAVADGALYISYPVLATADEPITIEALLVTKEHGVTIFDLPPLPPDWNSIRERQDQLFFAVKNNLGRHSHLRKGRDIGVTIEVISFFPQAPERPSGSEVRIADPTSLRSVYEALPPQDENLFRDTNAALQRVTSIKPYKKRASAQTPGSRGMTVKAIESEMANLDRWQKIAAIETPNGPQRIRGLAGSGKTIVLALKAALLHSMNPEWNIAVTFHTRSLYQQIRDLIRRFTFEHMNDLPNWEKLQVLHAWGGQSKSGVYARLAQASNHPVRDFAFARQTFGSVEPFEGVCSELLAIAKERGIDPIYDAVLIDEAQDLPPSFFQLIWQFTKEPKRVIWAYDELQSLTGMAILPTAGLFGVPVDLSRSFDEPRKDIILPVCYRNPPWTLTLAHALGLGIYRRGNRIVQFVDDPAIWTEIGYEVVDGELASGMNVVLKRGSEAHPKYFSQLLKREDAVEVKKFENEVEQAAYVAERIEENLKRDELEPDDILVILPDPITARRKAIVVMDILESRGIPCHLAGVTSSQDEMFIPGSVTLTGIFRAKGNEAPMVYILNCQDCMRRYELITARNTLFTAVTRSRAWVRLYGFGDGMSEFSEEVNSVCENDYTLAFRVPTSEELQKLRMIHRDRSPSERQQIRSMEKNLEEVIKVLRGSDISIDSLPKQLRLDLKELIEELRRTEDES